MKRTIIASVVGVAVAISGVAVAQEGGERPDDVNNAYHPDAPDHLVLAGADRYETAALVAINSEPRIHAEVLYIANGERPIDALGIGVIPNGSNKLLLVTESTVPAATADALGQFRVAKVVFLGGDSVISPSVRDEVMSLTEAW